LSRTTRQPREERAGSRLPAKAGRRQAAVRRHRLLWVTGAGAAVVILAAIIVLGARQPAAPSTSSSPTDFDVVAYQGEEVWGGHQTNFSHVLREGKPVVLNFFAGACPPCQAEMPGYERIFRSVSDRVIFVGVDVGPFLNLGSHDDARRLLQELAISYPAAYAVDDRPVKAFIFGMPTTIFFDSKGAQVDQNTGILTEDQLSQRVKKLLGA